MVSMIPTSFDTPKFVAALKNAFVGFVILGWGFPGQRRTAIMFLFFSVEGRHLLTNDSPSAIFNHCPVLVFKDAEESFSRETFFGTKKHHIGFFAGI